MKKMLTLLTLIFAIFTLVPAALADSNTLQTANALYSNGRYAEAIRAYETLVDQGVDDAALYYNLGNAYYQSGDLGHAILNYRRAEQLAPRQADIQHNLALARQQTGTAAPTVPTTFVASYLTTIAPTLTLNETAVIALGLWTAVCGLVWAIRRQESGKRRTALQYSLVPVSLLLLLAVFTLGGRLHTANQLPNAVLIAQTADLHSGPGAQFASDTQLSGGAEVTLYQTRGDWSQIGLPGSATRAWVAAPDVELVER